MRLVAIGLVAGVFSALFGVGGGILAVPLLIIFLHLPERVATATSLGAIGITALAGSIVFALRGDVEVGHAALVGIPAAAGALARHRAPAADHDASAGLRVRRAPHGGRRLVVGRMSTSTILLAVALGIAAGVLSGLFGVGGGILFVPTLVALGLGQLEAQATSLVAVLPTVAAGAWNQRRYGNLRVRTAVILGVASILGVLVGAWIAIALPETTLRRLFAVLLFVVAARLAWRTFRTRPRYPESP